MQKTTTFLMFVGEQYGKAEEAMNFYASLFPDSEIKEVMRAPAGAPGKEGAILKATLRLGEQEYFFSDSGAAHAFNFTPSISIFVRCDSEQELDKLYNNLSSGGSVMMPPGSYGFSKKFSWVADRFGISWQLNFQ